MKNSKDDTKSCQCNNHSLEDNCSCDSHHECCSDKTVSEQKCSSDCCSENTECNKDKHDHCSSGCACGLMDLDEDENLYSGDYEEEKSIFGFSSETVDKFTLIFGAALFVVALFLRLILKADGYGTLTIVIFITSYLLLGGEVVWTAIRNIIKGEFFDENFLMSIATIGAFVIGEYPEGVGVMLFYRIGELFEEVAVKRSKSQIMGAVDMRPETVIIADGDESKEIPAKNAKIGDIIRIRPGDRIPLDGTIVSGKSQLDTSPVTGEPVPIGVNEGSELLSGCVNINGTLLMKVTKPLSESMVTRILKSVQEASANKPKIDNFIKRFAKIYTPIVVVLALITAIGIPLITGQDFYKWVYTALTFLVMSCPCALVLSVPLAYFCGIGAASKQGILFKGGIVLEVLASIKAIVLDKTGTITKGNFVVQNITSYNGLSDDEIISLCASCETASTHPIGISIISEAKNKGLGIAKPANIQEISGHGIEAEIDGKTILCGNMKLMKKYGVRIDKTKNEVFRTKILIAQDNVLIGEITLDDTIKPDSKEAIEQLNKSNIMTAMLTGDSENSARRIAETAGIKEVHAKLLPEQKYDEIQKIRKTYGSVMFVGDGINDAPVLAGSDVGAAMGSGADAAIEAADVVFMNSNMSAVPKAVHISKKTSHIAMQNVIFALTIKIIVMILGVTGIYSNMWLAVFADTGVAFICILNSIRLLRIK